MTSIHGIKNNYSFEYTQHILCRHPDHSFPCMLYIPPGQTYTHICPDCGQSISVTAPLITYGVTRV